MDKVALLAAGLSLGLLGISLLGLFFWPAPMPMMMQMMPEMFVMMIWPILLVASIVTFLMVWVFYFVYRLPVSPTPSTNSYHPPDNPEYASQIIARFLKPDEQRVIQILREVGGSLLQKEIAKRTGFTRLKTHRTLARLAERRAIEVQRAGNTNKISLADWLKKSES